MTVVNGSALLLAAPMKNMLSEKLKFGGASHGLAEVGYDIRLKQDIHFYPPEYSWTSEGYTMTSVPSIKVDGKEFMGTRFTLASAIEEFDMPHDLMGIVHDKSTWARRGLSVFNTVIEPGWKGFLTLELVHHGNDYLHLPAGVGIAQVIFHKLRNLASYEGKYQNQEDRPVEAILKG